MSNLVSSRWSATGVVPGRSFIAKRLGIACWVWATAWRQPFQLVGPGHSILRVAGLRSFSVPGWCFGCRDERWRLWPNRGAAGRPERNQGVCRLCRESDSPDALYGRQKQYERWKTPLVYPTHGVRIGCNADYPFTERVHLAGRVDLARGRVYRWETSLPR